MNKPKKGREKYMKNTTVKIIAILVALAGILAVAGTACGKKDDSLVYRKNGKIFYRLNPDDNAYELVTDAKGETVVDEQGNLLWKVTDVNGEDQTMPVSFPSYLTEGGKISCQEFTIKLPSGYENIGGDAIMLRNDKKGTQIDYTIFEATEGEEGNTAAARAQIVEEFFQTAVAEKSGTVTKKEVQIGGRDAICLIIDMSNADPQSYMEAYYIDSVNGVMAFSCSCKNYAEKDKVDFKAILDTIEYRV